MARIINRYVLVACFFLVTLCLSPVQSEAALAIQTEVVSGNILQKNNNNEVKLDNGEMYQPSRATLIVNVGVGQPVTLRYVVGADGKNVFFEFAPGLNSLRNSPPAATRRDNKPK